MTRAPRRRPGPPDEIAFPVTPMLDMAFQLLAFFILTYQTPSRETRIDLYLPAAPVALPRAPAAPARSVSERRRAESDLETDLKVVARADPRGGLASLTLAGVAVPGPEALGDRLRRYAEVLGDEPLRVLLVADDRLRYAEAARVLGTCAAAGVDSIRLAGPRPGRPARRAGP
jgi:biopolymer transport protein ExbD